jgi:ankyrin repeat protein
MPTIFEDAIRNNNHDYIRKGLNQWQPVPANSANAAFQTGLMIACQHKSVETVKVFLKKSTAVKNEDPSFCNVNLADASGWTALHYAAHSGSFDCVKLLIKNQADIDAFTDKNETPLFLATMHNHPDSVELLAANNCQLQTKSLFRESSAQIAKDFTALEVAVLTNFVEIAKCLLFHLIRTKELNEEDLDKLLVKAAGRGHIVIANELLISGANVNYQGGTIS